MNRMRQRIAERLKEAQNTNAMLTTFNEIDLLFVFLNSGASVFSNLGACKGSFWG